MDEDILLTVTGIGGLVNTTGMGSLVVQGLCSELPSGLYSGDIPTSDMGVLPMVPLPFLLGFSFKFKEGKI